jgi:glycosyltransferase involved in cell wall biosynthesis
MRFCFISLEDIILPPGGIATYLQGICTWMASQGHEVHVISRKLGQMPSEETYMGVQIHRVSAPGPTFFYAPLFFLKSRIRYLRLASNVQINLIHSDIPLMGAVALLGLQTPPIVETVHATTKGLLFILGKFKPYQANLNENLTRLLSPILQYVERILLYHATKIISVSQGLYNEIISQNEDLAPKCVVIPNGIELHKFSNQKDENAEKTRKKLGVSSTDPIILYLGRLMATKRVSDLINAMPIILREIPNAKLIIVGKWNKNALELRKVIKELGLIQHIIMVDHIAYSEIQDYYGMASVYALPSSYEGFPFTIIEAMASGVPVIAAEIPGITEQITHKITGLLHPVGDVEAIASGVCQLLIDHSLASKLSTNAKKMVEEKFTWDVIGSKTEKLFIDVIEKSNYAGHSQH